MKVTPIVRRLREARAGLVLASSSWLAFGQAIQMLSAFAAAAIVARVLGPADFGTFSLITMMVTLGASFIAFGSTQFIQIRMAVAPESEPALAWAGMFIQLAGALLAIPILLALLYFSIGNQIESYVFPALALSLVASAGEALSSIYFARTQGRKMAMNLIARSAFVLVLRCAVALIYRDLNLLCLTILAEKVFASGWLYLSLSRDRLLPGYRRPEFQLIGSILRDSWPVFVSMVAVAVYLRIDMFMIEAMLPPDQLGYYTAAVRIAEAWYLVPSVLCQSLLPSLARVHATNEQRYGEVLTLSYGLMFWSGVGAAVVMTTLAVPALWIAFGSSYTAGAGVLAITSWTGIFAGCGGITRQATNLGKSQQVLMWGTVAGAALNVGLNLMLIPRWGISGAALATLVSYMVPSWLAVACSSRTMPLFRLMTAAPLAVAEQAFRRLTSGRAG